MRDGMVIGDAVPWRGRNQLRQRAQHAQHVDDDEAHAVADRDVAAERWSVQRESLYACTHLMHVSHACVACCSGQQRCWDKGEMGPNPTHAFQIVYEVCVGHARALFTSVLGSSSMGGGKYPM